MLEGYIVLWGSLTITELMWCIVGTTGILVSAWNLFNAWGDWRFLRRNKLNGQLRSIALSAIEQEVLSIAAQGAVIAIGIIAAESPSADPNRPRQAIEITLIACLFIISCAITIKSLRRRYWRYKIVHQGREAQQVNDK